MSVQYLHGIETIELDSPAGPIATVKSNVIGLIGTAPDADVNKFPLNTPVAVFANSLMAADLKTGGTLLDAMDAIYAQGSAVVVVVRVEEGQNANETYSNVIGSPTLKTGVWSFLKSRPLLKVTPRLLVAPGHTSGRPTSGVASVTIGTPGTGYVQASTTVTFQAAPAGGRTATGVATVTGGAITAITITDPGYGYVSPPTITITGAGTSAAATAVLGGVANPVGMALASLAPRVRGVAFVDGPGTNYTDAIAYRNDYGSQRVMVIDPGVLKWDTVGSAYVSKPASAYAAGIQARIDREKGFWYSLSNEEIRNIGGPSRPVDWEISDPSCEANILNENEITTVIHDNGFRFWGVRGTGSDPLWAHLSVRRTADMVYESLERAHRDRMDKPFSFALLDNIQESVRGYLRQLKVRGALIGGDCWIDPALNTPQTFANGELAVDFDLEPPALLEKLQFRARRNPAYYEDFIEEFTASVAN